MTPFEVKLAYKGRSWLTVVLEIGHEEIGSFAMSSRVIAADVVEMFVAVGLPTPNAIPVLAVEHQIAQKLHACSAPRSDRAHDLVDLQLLAREDGLDLVVIQQTVRRLFVARNGHSWPPVISVGEGWVGRYAEAAAGLDVISRVDDAIGWANAFIADISGT